MSVTPEQIRASRVLEIKVGDCVFHARRPKWEEVGLLFWEKPTDAEIARRYVTGWRNVRAKDLFLDGSDEFVGFDQEVWEEASGDMAYATKIIAERVLKEAKAYQEKEEAARKNSVAG